MPTTLSAFARRLRSSIEDAAPLDFPAAALELFQLQYTACAAYRRWCDSLPVRPEEVRRWTEIPAIPTAAFQELELTSLPPPGRVAVFHSSGTTGQRRSRHFHGPESLALYEASARAWFLRCAGGMDRPASRMISLTPSPADAPHSSLVHMFATLTPESPLQSLGNVDRDGVWHVDHPRVFHVLSSPGDERSPVMLMGTAFQFVHLVEWLDAGRLHLSLPEGSRVMETGGYKGRSRVLARPDLHAAIARCLGIPVSAILGEYGMSELSSQAYDSVDGVPDTGRFRFPPWARVVAVSPETGRVVAPGELGVLRIFDLANVWSVLALQTGDLGIVDADGAFALKGRAPAAEPRGCSLMTA